MSITANRLPWRHDINVFMTPVEHLNGNSNQVSTTAIRNGSSYLATHAGTASYRIYYVTLAKGTWTIEVMHEKNSNRGILTVEINGVSVGTIDAYAASFTENNRSSITGISITTSGKKTLKLSNPTKNASSSAYQFNFHHIQLRRTA